MKRSLKPCWKGKLTRHAGLAEAIQFLLPFLAPAKCGSFESKGAKGQFGCFKACWQRWALHLLHSMRLHISVGQLGLITAAAQQAAINWQSGLVCEPNQYMWLLHSLMVRIQRVWRRGVWEKQLECRDSAFVRNRGRTEEHFLQFALASPSQLIQWCSSAREKQ